MAIICFGNDPWYTPHLKTVRESWPGAALRPILTSDLTFEDNATQDTKMACHHQHLKLEFPRDFNGWQDFLEELIRDGRRHVKFDFKDPPAVSRDVDVLFSI